MTCVLLGLPVCLIRCLRSDSEFSHLRNDKAAHPVSWQRFRPTRRAFYTLADFFRRSIDSVKCFRSRPTAYTYQLIWVTLSLLNIFHRYCCRAARTHRASRITIKVMDINYRDAQLLSDRSLALIDLLALLAREIMLLAWTHCECKIVMFQSFLMRFDRRFRNCFVSFLSLPIWQRSFVRWVAQR